MLKGGEAVVEPEWEGWVLSFEAGAGSQGRGKGRPSGWIGGRKGGRRVSADWELWSWELDSALGAGGDGGKGVEDGRGCRGEGEGLLY